MLLLARYVLPVSEPYIDDGAVLVRDGEIVDVGGREALLARYPDAEVKDYGQAALLPGFVDLHTHFEYSVFRGMVNDAPYSQWKMQVMAKEALLSPEDWERSAVLGAVETIRCGITTVADVTDSGSSVLPAVSAKLRGVIYREVSTMDKSRIEGVMDEALEDLAEWGSVVDPALVSIGIAPHSPYSCHPELIKRVAEYASAHGTPVAIHLAGSKDEYEFVRFGSSPLAQEYRNQSGWSQLAWLPTGVSPVKYVLQWGILDLPNVLAVHCVHADAADIEILASRDVAVAYCARCNLKLGMGIAPLHDLLERGVRVGIGTDSPASNSTIDFFDEMRIGLLVQRGVVGEAHFYPSERFIRMATLDGARALRIDHLVGSLEPGKRADIIAVDLSRSHQVPTTDPYSAVVHVANQEDILMTMVDGRVLYENGEYFTLHVEGLADEIDDIQRRLRTDLAS
ncbi:MAG TPA: amidohydrolase family protein [Coriobacteriia bacterium]|nr:amidohydrolase family protein [Coriobacteriia bacterium]